MFQHILPNVLGPVLVIATINLALAIITEATLSFLGVGLPPTEPSLGTMIQIGNKYLFSGSWWMVAFPGLTLAVLALAVNLLGDWLRDALNPRLQVELPLRGKRCRVAPMGAVRTRYGRTEVVWLRECAFSGRQRCFCVAGAWLPAPPTPGRSDGRARAMP